MDISFRPLPNWPYPATPDRRFGQFKHRGVKIPWERTLRDLQYEVEMLDGHDIIIGAGYAEGDVRRDRQPRADARAPRHPGVEISFESRYGRLTYATDVFWDWRDNVRAVALGLEALRAIDRWGVARRGQQYAGFAQLPAGGPDATRGKALVEAAGGMTQALKRHHPDAGGNERDFIDVTAYRKQARP